MIGRPLTPGRKQALLVRLHDMVRELRREAAALDAPESPAGQSSLAKRAVRHETTSEEDAM